MEGWIVLYPYMIMSASTETGEKFACWWVQLILALLKLGKHVSANGIKGALLPRDLLLFGRSSSLQKNSYWIEYDLPQDIGETCWNIKPTPWSGWRFRNLLSIIYKFIVSTHWFAKEYTWECDSTTRLIFISTFEQVIILACLTSNMAKHSRSQSSC